MGNDIRIDWQEIDETIDKYGGSREALVMIMQDISDIYNYVPPEVVPVLVKKLGVRESLIYSVATFYKAISLHPRGKYVVNVCTGTACHVRGADRIMEALQDRMNIKEGQTTQDLLFTLQSVRCVGCCASGPVIRINKDTHGGLDRSSATKVIDHYERGAS